MRRAIVVAGLAVVVGCGGAKAAVEPGAELVSKPVPARTEKPKRFDPYSVIEKRAGDV